MRYVPQHTFCEKANRKLFALLTLKSCATHQEEVMKVQHATEQHVKQELVHQVQSNSHEQTGYNVSQWMTTNGTNQVNNDHVIRSAKEILQ